MSGGLKSEALTPLIVVVALVETEPLAYVKVQVLLGGVPVRVQNPLIVRVAVAVPAALVVQGEFTDTLPPPAQTPVIVAFGTGLPVSSFNVRATVAICGVVPALLVICVGFAVNIALPTVIVTDALKPPAV